MPKRVMPCVFQDNPYFEKVTSSNKKPVNLSCIVLGDILVIQYDGNPDQSLMTEWNSSNVPVSLGSRFSGYIYYKRYHLGRNI